MPLLSGATGVGKSRLTAEVALRAAAAAAEVVDATAAGDDPDRALRDALDAAGIA